MPQGYKLQMLGLLRTLTLCCSCLCAVPVLRGRTGCEAYADLMRSFRHEFGSLLEQGAVTDVLIGGCTCVAFFLSISTLHLTDTIVCACVLAQPVADLWYQSASRTHTHTHTHTYTHTIYIYITLDRTWPRCRTQVPQPPFRSSPMGVPRTWGVPGMFLGSKGASFP